MSDKILDQVEKKYGKGSIRKLGDQTTVDVDVISTQCKSIDEALGVGGIPRGRIIEIYGPESCLASDTFIQYEIKTLDGKRVNHKGGTISHLYKRFNDIPTGDGRVDRYSTDNYEYYLSSINEKGRIIQNKIKDVVSTGQQQTFKVTTKKGHVIKATKNHKFYVGSTYKKLSNLSVGDEIFIHNNTPYTVDEYDYKHYKEWLVKDHPNKNLCIKTINDKYKYYRLGESRAVLEAKLNNLSVDEYRNKLNSGDVDNLKFIPTELHIHHIDENTLNNEPDNLVVLDPSEHGKLHMQERDDNLRYICVSDEIVSIEEHTIEDTYDISMNSPYRNYVANNFVVHNSGKTTLTMHVMSEAQRMGLKAAIIDAEHAFDPKYAKNLGIDVDELVISQPDSGEEALGITQMLVDSGEYGVIVVDSVSALVPKAELEGEMGDSHMGLQARLMSQAMRKLTSTVQRTNTSLIFINQIRHKIGVMYGSPETTSGGRALRFYASVRIDIRRTGSIKSGEEFLGNTTKVKIKKNKVASPFKVATFNIMFGTGIDSTYEIFKEAKEKDIITKHGSWFRLKGEEDPIAQGEVNAVEWIKENKEKVEKMLRDGEV